MRPGEYGFPRRPLLGNLVNRYNPPLIAIGARSLDFLTEPLFVGMVEVASYASCGKAIKGMYR